MSDKQKVGKETRKDTFKAYRTERVSNREALVRRALELLSTEKYDTVTALAKNVAQLVAELEKRQAKDGEAPREMSYTTLVRNRSKYKHILRAHFDRTHECNKSDDEAELEELRLHCVHLEHENDLLKQRLSYLGERKGPETSSEPQERRFSAEDIEMLIDLADGIISQVRDVFDVVGPNDIDEEYPYPGIYGPEGLIAEYETLQRMNELREELRNETK